MRMPLAAVGLVGPAFVAALLSPKAAAPISSGARPLVPCDEIILDTKFPYRTDGYRIVLGDLAVPPAYLRQVVATGRTPWTHWRKAGLVVRAGSPRVIVTVPPAWRRRVAITWGNGSAGDHSASLAIESCGGPANVGHAYAGGFSLGSASVCVPIVFRVGSRQATIRFGIGRRC